MLSPYRVLDLTDHRGEIGPMLLGDLGADVIRVETPEGSAARRRGPVLDGAPADLSSRQFIAFNRNKRSIALDPEAAADCEALHDLVRSADFVFEASPNRPLARYGIDFEELRQLNSRLVYVRLSPFGDSGPYSGYQADDLVIAAMGGPVSLQGFSGRPPLRVSTPQVWRHAGVESAAAALAAHARMQKTGSAQFVDLSAQSVMTWTMLNSMSAHAIQGFDFQRDGSRVNTGTVAYPILYRCLGGYIVVLPTASVIVPCLEWMIADGVLDETARDVDWQAADLRILEPDTPYTLDKLSDLIQQFVSKHTKKELLEFGMANATTLAPVNTIPELLALDHLGARDYWSPRDLPTGQTVRSPGPWAKPSRRPLSARRGAPALNEHGEEIRDELKQPREDARAYPAPVGEELPFEGIKVADFSWVGVGPISAKYLADHGADVVRVESESRLDVLRLGGPHKDGVPGLNRSQFYGDFNTSKRSLGLSLKEPGAVEIARKMIAWSDVFIESFAPGAVERLGLSYEEVRKLNPNIIMLSTCLMGQTGPASGFAGYGYHAGAMAGFYEVTGWPDEEPCGPWIAYTDTIAPRFISTLLAAALDHRRRTGEGQYIDVAQLEASLHFLAPEILDCEANGFAATRLGNRARDAAPQGCYPCAGDDQWCAIAIDDDEQWQALRRVLGDPEWARAEGLATVAGRLAQHDEIDAGIGEWTRSRDPRSAMQELQSAGVPAGVVQRSQDLHEDPQYQHRQFYRDHEHLEMGRVGYAGHQYKIRDYDNGPRSAAPCLAQHSIEVLCECVGMSEEEIGEAYAAGLIA